MVSAGLRLRSHCRMGLDRWALQNHSPLCNLKEVDRKLLTDGLCNVKLRRQKRVINHSSFSNTFLSDLSEFMKIPFFF